MSVQHRISGTRTSATQLDAGHVPHRHVIRFLPLSRSRCSILSLDYNQHQECSTPEFFLCLYALRLASVVIYLFTYVMHGTALLKWSRIGTPSNR